MADAQPWRQDSEPNSVRARLNEISKQAELVAEQTDDDSLEYEIKEVPIVVDHCLALLDRSGDDE